MKYFRYINTRLSSGGIFVGALMIVNFLNFLFNVILGRRLSLEEFSLLTLASTLWFVISIFLTGIASTTTNRTAYLSTKRGESIAGGFRSFITKKAMLISFLLTVVWLILTPLFSIVFHTSNLVLFLSIAPAIIFGIYASANRGYFQGELSFIKAAIIILSEGVSKLLIALVLIYLGLSGLTYLSIPASIFITFLVTFFLVTRMPKKKVEYNYAFPRRLLFATTLVATSGVAFITIDLLFARHFLSASESGAYALLSLVGKMVLFAGSLLSVFILTYASRDMGENKNSTNGFYKILTLNIFLLGIAYVALGIFGQELVPLMFGAKSAGILEYIRPYVIGIIFFTVASAFTTYHLAKQQFIFAYNSILASILLALVLVFMHGDVGSFVTAIIVVSFYYLSSNILLHVLYKDSSEYIDEEDKNKFGDFGKLGNIKLSVSICIPAYNEAKNIGKLLTSLLNQETYFININKIVIVSSASTDKTDEIVKDFAKKNKNIILIREDERKGKATAINAFLKINTDPVVVVQSADTIPVKDTIEKLCRPFLIDKTIGMTGGAPIPINDKETFLGFVIHTWWWFHRNIPRFGEIIAFRNIIDEVSPRTAVDEAYIQAKFAQMGYRNVHVEDAIIYNKGSENIRDIIKQRRRIFNGHTRLHKEENVHISHMSKSGFKLLFFEYKIYGFRQLVWLFGGMGIEFIANLLGRWDKKVNNINPVAWDIASSTKDLGSGGKK